MSIFAANKGWLSVAQTAMSNAETVATQQRDINVGRELLANIRQYRIQKALFEQAEAYTGETKVSGIQTGAQFLQQQVEQPYQRALDDAERQEQIAEYQRTAQAAISRYKKQAKTARTTGYVTAALLAATGGFLAAGAVAGEALGATLAGSSTAIAGGAVVGGVAGGALAAGTGAALGADSNFQGGAISGTITGTSIAVAGSSFMGPGASTGGTVSEAGGGSVTTKIGGQTVNGLEWGNALTPEVSTIGGQWSALQYLAAGKILNTIGGAVKDINNYQAKVPVSQGYIGQNYSQYVQSFRGFA